MIVHLLLLLLPQPLPPSHVLGLPTHAPDVTSLFRQWNAGLFLAPITPDGTHLASFVGARRRPPNLGQHETSGRREYPAVVKSWTVLQKATGRVVSGAGSAQ
jgi:hypothetical protein